MYYKYYYFKNKTVISLFKHIQWNVHTVSHLLRTIIHLLDLFVASWKFYMILASSGSCISILIPHVILSWYFILQYILMNTLSFISVTKDNQIIKKSFCTYKAQSSNAVFLDWIIIASVVSILLIKTIHIYYNLNK